MFALLVELNVIWYMHKGGYSSNWKIVSAEPLPFMAKIYSHLANGQNWLRSWSSPIQSWSVLIPEIYPCFYLTFKSRARQNFGASLQRCNSPHDGAGELSKPSSDSASLLLEIKKKNWFRFRFGVRWGDRCKLGCFAFFWPPLPGPGPQPIGPLFWLNIFGETRPKSASLELSNNFLAYREWKLWLINQKLTKISLP